MTHFDYVRATSLEQAISLINDQAYQNKLLSGGTDLLVYMHHGQLGFDRLVDISLLPELKLIQRNGDEITLGAGVTFTEVIECQFLRDTVPFLVEACRWVGSPQIRNLGTLGGNVVNAAACADSLPVLVCLEADAHLCSLRGERVVPVTELVLGPNRTQIERGEVLTHFTFLAPPDGVKTAFIKLGRRNALAISRLTMAAMGRLDTQERIDFIRLTPGAATPQTIRFTQVEVMLSGETLSVELISAAARQVADVMIGYTGRRWSTEYKSRVITSLAERVLGEVFRERPFERQSNVA
jgi:CO/xanthine dehydrogenase FAD-binding subunit